MITVNLPDGTQLQFPDGTSEEVMRSAIRSLMADGMQGLAAPNSQPEPTGGVSVNPEAAGQLGDQISSGVMGLRNGLSLGFVDNIKGGVIGGLGGGVAQPDGSISMFNYDVPTGDRYASVRDQVRAENAQAQQEAPGTYALGNIAGGMVPGALAAPEIGLASLPMMAARLTGFGALEGGLLGAGNADGQDVAQSAMQGGLLGAVTGLAAPLAVGAARYATRPLAGVFDAITGRASPARAGLALDRAVRRSGMTQDDIAAAIQSAQAEGQPGFVVADALGNAGQRALAGVSRVPSDGRQQIVDFLNTRQLGQNERVSSFVADALQAPDTAAMRAAEQARQRGLDAGVNYNAAREAAVPVDTQTALDIIDNRLSATAGVNIAPAPIDTVLQRFRARLEVPASSLPPGVTNMRLSDFGRVFEVKRDLQDEINSAIQANRGGEADLLIELKNAIDDALAQASPGYADARNTYRMQSQALDAIQSGRDAARPTVRTQDALNTYNNLPTFSGPPTIANAENLPGLLAPAQNIPDPRAAFRVGYADPLLARVENRPETNNAILPFMSPKNMGVMEALANDPALWARRADRENTMFQTRQSAIGGSATADNLADAADMQGIDPGFLATLAQGRFGAAATQLAQKGAHAATGLNEKTRNLIAQALLSSDPQAALAPLLRRAMMQNGLATAGEAAIRQSAFQGLLAN